MVDFFSASLVAYGLSYDTARVVSYSVFVLCVLSIIWVLYSLLCRYNQAFYELYRRMLSRHFQPSQPYLSKPKIIDFFISQVFFRLLQFLFFALLFYYVFSFSPVFSDVLTKVFGSAIVVVCVFILRYLSESALFIYQSYPIAKKRPIKGYVQLVMIFVYCVACIFVISILSNRSPWALFAGFGAVTAILVVIFKDTIVGVVVSFQLNSNKMLKLGDWIEMGQCYADGEVVEITLHTLKIQNWDNTITMIPAFKFISEPFKHWTSMQESGGRRIKRVLYIDIASIKFCNSELVESFKKNLLLKEYIESKLDEIRIHNTKYQLSEWDIHTQRFTNVGIFRTYIQKYLHSHPKIHQTMTLLVRHLEPGSHGLPIEIYAFSKEIEWDKYEELQADIFDHLFSVVSFFELKVFQSPSGRDIKSLRKR